MRTKEEIEARISLVDNSNDILLTSLFDDCLKATEGMSPSAAFRLASLKARAEGCSSLTALAVAKAVRWKRILERDYPAEAE